MPRGQGHLDLEAEERGERQVRVIHRVRGDDQIHLRLDQGRQGGEALAGDEVDFHFGPVAPIAVDGRQQPVVTAVALHHEMQTASESFPETSQVGFRPADLGKHAVREIEQTRARRREAQGSALAHEERLSNRFFKPFELVRERRLSQMQTLRRPGQRSCLLNLGEGPQVFRLHEHDDFSSKQEI